jgi:hypothetical protein
VQIETRAGTDGGTRRKLRSRRPAGRRDYDGVVICSTSKKRLVAKFARRNFGRAEFFWLAANANVETRNLVSYQSKRRQWKALQTQRNLLYSFGGDCLATHCQTVINAVFGPLKEV